MLLSLFVPTLTTYGQFKYPHRYFDPREYQSDRKVFCMDQAADGTMYFGTPSSLLKFDGERWKLTSIPGEKAVYWLTVDDATERIYVGTTGEFGYFDFDLNYVSLSDQLDASIASFGTIWEVKLTSHGVYFRSSRYIFRYHEGQLSHIAGIGPKEYPFDIISVVNDTIFTRIREVGLGAIYQGEISILKGTENFTSKTNAFIPHSDGLLVATRSNGLFLYQNQEIKAWNVPINEKLKENRVYHATALSNGLYAFANLTGGALLIDRQGKLVHSIKRHNYGIFEGTEFVFEDQQAGLWVATGKGMTLIDINSPIQYYRLDEMTENASFVHFDQKLYFGSLNGLYMLPDNHSEPQRVIDFPDLVTRIYEADDMLIATDLSYFFQVNGSKAQKGSYPPFTCLTPINSSEFNYVGGGQEGLYFLKKTKDWKIVKRDENSVKNLDKLVTYKESLWGISSSNGLFQYSEDSSRFYSIDDCYSLKVYENLLTVTTKNAFYFFDSATDQFQPFEELNKLISDEFHAIEDFYVANDQVWILYYNKEKVLTGDVFANNRLIRKLPCFDARIEENIEVQLTEDMLIISNGDHIFRYQQEANPDSMKRQVNVFISSEQLQESSDIPYSQNKLRFDFSLKSFYTSGNNYYRYRLQGYDNDWTEWSTQNYMEITNLTEGDYVLHLEAKTPSRSHASASYVFSILPPWYRTYWAYIFYLMLLGTLLWGIVKSRSRYLERERKRLEILVAKRTSEIIAQKATIEQSLLEREALLREVHHRVKNNLQVISSIFNMQLKQTETDEIRKLINDGQSRMKTMSLIHQKLYQSERLDVIAFEDYITTLISQINQLYNKGQRHITHEVDAGGIHLDIDTAIPVGLILNELLSNSYKYAFENDSGNIVVKITKDVSGNYLLVYRDDGEGLPGNFSLDGNDSLGLRLVSILVRQLKGELKFKNENGACFQITFQTANI